MTISLIRNADIQYMLCKTISKFSVGKEAIWQINDLFWTDFMHSYVWLQNILKKISLKIIVRHISRQTSGSKIQRNQTVPQAGIRKCSQKWDSQVNGWTDLSNQTVNRNLSSALAANNRFVSHEMETANIGSHFFFFFSRSISRRDVTNGWPLPIEQKSQQATQPRGLSHELLLSYYFFLVLASGKISYRFQNEKKNLFSFFLTILTHRPTEWSWTCDFLLSLFVLSEDFFFFVRKLISSKDLLKQWNPLPTLTYISSLLMLSSWTQFLMTETWFSLD